MKKNIFMKKIKAPAYSWVIVFMGLLTVAGALGLARFGYTSLLSGMKDGLNLSEAQTGDLAAGNMIGYLLLALFGVFLLNLSFGVVIN